MSNTMFLGCVSKSCSIAVESGLSIDYLCLLRDRGISYENTSCVIKILLSTQKSIKTPYLICLNASQSEFNDAIFTQTCFRVHPPLFDIDKSLIF